MDPQCFAQETQYLSSIKSFSISFHLHHLIFTIFGSSFLSVLKQYGYVEHDAVAYKFAFSDFHYGAKKSAP